MNKIINSSHDINFIILPDEIKNKIFQLDKTKKKEILSQICSPLYNITINMFERIKLIEKPNTDISDVYKSKKITHLELNNFSLKNLTPLPTHFINTQSITMTNMGIEKPHLEILSEFEKLTHLDFSSCSFIDEAATFLPRLTHLRKLTLPAGVDYQTISDEGLNSITSLPCLEELDLSSIQSITDEGLKNFNKLTHLSKLNLSFCRNITDNGLAHLAKLENLKELNLEGCDEITDAGLNYIAELKNLSILNLSNCRKISDAGLMSLSELVRLKKIGLSKCDISGLGLTHLNAPELEHLDLSDCKRNSDATLKDLLKFEDLKKIKLRGAIGITDEGLKYLGQLKNLSSLDLSNCWKISSEGLKDLFLFPNLKELNLSGCELTDDNLKVITELKKLEKLYLRSSIRLTSEGFSELSKLENLKKLSLRYCNQIKNKDLTPISSCLKRLSSLDLADCILIDDEGLKHLSELKKLKKLRLSGCHKITEEGINLLAYVPEINKPDSPFM